MAGTQAANIIADPARPSKCTNGRAKNNYGSRTCKPNSVLRIAPAGRPFLWATHCCVALATYPKV